MIIRIYRDSAAGDASGGAPGSAAASVVLPAPANGAAGAAPAPAAGAFTIPDAYKDKPYLKGVDSLDKVYGMLDGAQTLIGKRPTGIPAADAPQEEWEKFYAVVRPEKPEAYVFDATEGLPREEKLDLAVKASMHKHGLTVSQAKGLAKDFDLAVAEVMKEKGLAVQQNDINFEALADKVFSTNKATALATAKTLIAENISPAMKEAIAKLPNESLIVLADVLNNVQAKYIKADGAPGGGPTATGLTPAEVQAKGRELMGSPAYTDFRHPQHQATVKQVKELYDSLNKK